MDILRPFDVHKWSNHTEVNNFVNSIYDNHFKLQKSEISKVQLPHLLKYSDKLSMYHSVESRLPFLDYKLIELSLSLNYRTKIRNGWSKYILRKMVEKFIYDRCYIW